jgi:hypothetical protein
MKVLGSVVTIRAAYQFILSSSKRSFFTSALLSKAPTISFKGPLRFDLSSETETESGTSGNELALKWIEFLDSQKGKEEVGEILKSKLTSQWQS